MKFELEIEQTFPMPDIEIERLLRSIKPTAPYGKVRDLNGNVIGAWSLQNPPLMIELYPMSGETLASYESEVTSWDVLLRPDGGDPLEEYEGLTREEAEDRMRILASQYDEAIVDTQLEDLLR